MTISTTELKIFRSQRNRDTADGGGAMAPTEVVDGELNNVFDDISSEDRVTGRVSVRKVFPGVFSNDTDRFFGAGLVVISPAIDPAVDVLLTRATGYDDERSDVVGQIESFMVPAGTLLWRLFNDHLQGTGSLTLFALSDAPSPDLGDTLFLQRRDDASIQEAVRIQEIVSRTTQTFVDELGTFQRDILVVQLSRPLKQRWDGTQVFRNTASFADLQTILRDSTVSAGAKYFGVKPITQDIAQGDLNLQVDNPFARIVPSTSAEVPVADQPASLAGVSFAPAGAENAITVNAGSLAFVAGTPKTVHIGGTVLPGSVAVSGTLEGEDNGGGTITFAGGDTGSVDYQTGAVTITRNTSGNVTVNLTATPAAAVQGSNLTVRILVTEQTRALNYIRTLRPLPAPGSLSVDYRALNNWFRLSDDGTGTLQGGQPGEGGGTINYATGTVTATLGALPDLDTSIIIRWGTPGIIRDGTTRLAFPTGRFSIDIPDVPFKPGSLLLSYSSGASTINLTSDAAGRIFEGVDQRGVYVPTNGSVTLNLPSDKWPDSGGQINYTVDLDTEQQEAFQPTPAGQSDQITFTLANVPIEPGSVRLTWPVEVVVRGRLYTFEVNAWDDGGGGLLYDSGVSIPGAAVNYTTGEVSIQAAFEA